MSNDNKKRLYDALSSTYDLGTFEDFSKDIEDEGKRRKLYEATQQEYDFGAYEDFSSQLGYAPAPSAREQLQAFYQENGAFLDDFEKRDSLDQQDAARNAMVNEGLSFFKPKSRVSDEERTRYKELAAQRNALEKAWYTSDEYLSQKNATALELGQMRDDIHNSKKAYVESQPQIKMSGLENAVMEGKTMGDYESQQFDIAARIMDKTIKLHNAPSKYDSNSGLKNMGIGAADKATDPALLSAGLTEITDNVGARVVLQKVQKELGGNLNDLSEEKIEKILSPAEKAVLRSWAMYAQEQLNRQGDLSLGYQAGQGAVESLAFMAEFALTGGVGKAASEGAETLAKWLGKKWYTGVKGLGDEAAEAVMKAAGEKTLGKYGQKLGLALAETAGRTLVMPSTYRNISEKATEIEEDEDGNRYLIGLNDAFIKGYADSFIENLSEGGRVNALGELVGDIAGKIPAWKKMVDAFSNTKASELLKRLNSTGIMNTLRAGGWHGFGEEYLEEWYGNALRTITGVDKNALKDFATLDNQMVTLASFLPITIFGGTVSTGQVISAKRDLDKKAEALQSALMSRGYDEAQAKNMIDMMRAETPQGISNLITPLIRRVAGANENEARELAKPAMEFAWAVQRYQSYDTKYSYQQQEQRDNLKADMETKLGKFWMEGEDGQQTVQRGVNEKGEVVYLLGKKDIEETAEGIGAEKEVAAIDAEGNHIFVFPSDYRLEEELPMNDFLGIEIMTQKRGSEAARMASESDAKLAEVKSRSRLGTQLNIGTNEAPVVATISKVDADGVVVETPEGFRKITYTELANKYADINPAVYTDAELDEQEADNISAERAQREAALDQEYENDDDAIEELAEAENEIEQSVEEATKLPLKDDGTVDQAALWNESPARWAKWNDEQKQDGGADTLAYLNTAIKAQTAKIEQLVAAQEAETDFDRRDAIAAELSEARMRQGDLLALHGQYTAQVEAQAIQQQAAQPVQPAPQLTEEEKAALEEERRKPLRAKAKELSEKLGVKVKIAEDLSDVKESKAREQLLKSVVSNGKQKVAGWYNQATGEVTIYLPHAESVEDVEKTFIHEVVAHKGLRGLLGEEGFNVLCDAVWDMMSEGDKIRFINYPGVNGDKRAAADEYMAHFAENLNLEEAKPDMWERIVAIIKQILDSMGVRLRINQEGLSSVIAASYQKLLADAKASQENTKKEVYNRHTTDKQSAETVGVSQVTEQSGTQPTSSMNTPTSFEDEVSDNNVNSNAEEDLNLRVVESTSPLIAAAQQEGESIRFSITTEESLQEKIRNFAKTKEGKATGWTEDDIESIIAETESLIDAIHKSSTGNEFYDEFAYKEPTIRVDWRDGEAKPIVTWTRANIEYKYDMSADLLCINNEGLEQVLSSDKMVALMEMFIPEKKAKKGEPEIKFTAEDYLELYNTLKDLGFVVPCKGCFDAAGRFKMLPSVAQKFAAEVNAVIDERNKDPKAFDDKLKAKSGEKTIDGLPTTASTKSAAIAVGVAGDNLTEHVKWTQLMSADGQTKMLSDWGGIFRAWQRTGAGRPKDKLLPEPYYGDIVSSVSTIIGKYGEKTPSFRDVLVNQGTGLRRNSHSEFRPVLAIDEIQFMRDAFIRNLTVFKYMKELDDVRLFGKMGVKFNMSFFPEYVPGTKVAGLDKDGNYIASEESVGSREFPYQGEDGKRHYDGMKGWAEAQKHINKDVSLSSVIFSIPHLLKALTDVPTPSDMRGVWGSLIPFHSSGATTASLYMQGLGMARANGVGHGFNEAFYDYGKGVTNFEAVQNDRFGEGWYIVSGKKAGENVEPGHKLEFANGNHYYNQALGVHLFASGYILDSELSEGMLAENGELNLTAEQKKALMHNFSIDYNDKVRELNGPYAYKAAADYYIAELPKLGLIPRFDFEVSEEKFLEMCEAAKVDPRHPKLGWKGEGNSWSPIDSEAYYSLFCDYGMTDPTTGEWAPHMPVGYVNEEGQREFRLPENAVEIVKEGLDRFSEVRRSENARIDEAIEKFAERSVEKGRISQKSVDKVLGKKSAPKKSSKSKQSGVIDLVEEAKKAVENTSDIRFSIIGEMGAMRDKSDEGLARLNNLEVARQMESELNPDWSAKNDENALKIKVATGWERGADGKWRYEVDDFMIKNENEWMDSKKKLTLRDIVEPHPVFDMYPDLLDIKIVKDRSKYNLGAYYDHKKNEMKLPFGALKDDADFARDFGYTPRESKSFMRTLQKMVMDILHEVQHAIQDREGFAPGGSSDMLMPEDRERYASLAKEYNALAEEYNAILDKEGYSKAAKEKLVQTERKEAEMKRFRQDHRIGGEGYKRLAGEVEAYNVETRHGLSDYERYNSLLASTEDVARKDQIFLMDAVAGDAQNNVSFRITPEMKEIKKQAEKDGTLMKAPNGQPTNLTEEQWLMVRTQNFKNWFGDWENDPENASKVVDENGEPKVVFHQTNQKIYVNSETGEIWDELGWKEKMEWDERDDWEDYWEEQDFNTFSRVNARTTNEFDGFFFAPEYDEYHEYGDRTIAAFVNIKNPASREDYNIDSRYNDAGRNERIRLQEAGFDGVIRMDGDKVDEYIAFEPNQIKSATDNNGDFNPKNNDIRFRVLDTAKAELKEKPIKLNGMYRFNLKNAFKGVKDNGGSYPYIKVQLEEVPEDYSGEKITYNGMLEGFAVVRVPKGLITEGEKDNEFFIDPKAIENELWDVLRATENYYEFKHGSAPYQRDWLNAEGVRFRIANENQAIFVSNAAKAVEGIKMEKATPEQWLKMIEKNGGLKAGEDKWMGLSDFLKSSDKKTLTKAEVLDFVNEHMIQIEETHYDINAESDAERVHDEITEKLRDRFDHYIDEYYEDNEWDDDNTDEAREYAIEKLREEMGDTFPYTIEREYGSVYLTFPYEEESDLVEWAEKTGVEYTPGVNPINDTRLGYTTDGLENKHEIALTVPSIESWNEGDDIHFGDAGDGRAVAWIRFGETEIPTAEYKLLLDEMDRLKEVARELYEEFGGRSNELEEVEARQEELRLEMRSYKNAGHKVLVIDEIQSKRHQEGREKGYKSKDYWPLRTSYLEKKTVYESLYDEMAAKYGEEFTDAPNEEFAKRVLDAEDYERIMKAKADFDAAADAYIPMRNAIPDAPFDKNWHELAMKRMLRYAAENGYDVVAWTKGDQQAERYNIGSYVSSIEMQEEYDGNRDFGFYMGDSDEATTVTVDENGIVVSAEGHLSQAEGRPLADLVGKDMAVKMMQMEEYDVLEDTDLKVGNEGMKGFYDRMLPAFMNKYGKKWGVKVSDIELPNVEESGRIMHSVPVTEEMKASVMEGQVMFRISESKGANESIPNYEFESDLRFRLSKNNRELIGKWLNKRGDLTEQAKEETLDLLDQFDDATLQLSMGKWFAQNAIRLPDDVEKCMQAVASAKKAKVDPMKFAAPMEIIDQYGVTKPKDKPINPDKVSTLSKVRELPNGLTIYDVEESEESRKNMREIINTHFGKESSPWCLLQGNDKGELTQKSAEYWQKYNAYPKQVVFKDGKLLAFCANDTEERRWWDRMDKSYAGIPVNEKLPNDRLGRSRVVEYNEETGKQAKVNDIKKFVTKDGMRSEWTWRTPKENDIKEYRKVKADTEEMVEGFDKSSWNIPSFLQKMLPKESVRFVRSAGVEMTFDAWGKILNYWDENTSIVYDGNETAIYTNDERYLYRNGKLVDVIDANNITYTGAETQRFSAKAKEHLTQAKDIQKNAKSIAKQMVADLQGESLRFRVRGENESAMDFTKKEVENFTKRFYDVAPIYVVDKFSSKAELAKALEMDEQYITDEQYQAILDGYNGNGKAFYSADWSLIITFAKSDNSDDIEHNLFHESVHKVDIEDIPDGGKLGQWFWDNADSIQDASTIKDAIENAPEYSEEDYAREMLAELLAWYMSIGETEILINQLPSEYQKTVKSILSEIRYDSREEDNLRQQPETTYSRAKDAIRKGTKEYGGKRENAKSNELSAEERRIIGEYFPEFNKSEDVRMRVNSQGKELTEGQREFFANSKAVDKDGNLLALYHGTPRAGFTEFKSGWFTTSKEDAISYSGDRKGRLFDPNEKYEPETLTAGDFRLGYMTFDSEEDRAAFLERFPYADEVMSEREYEDARMGAEDEEYDALTDRRKEFAEVWNAYREYERERFVDTTVGDLIANPEAYTEEDLMRAMLEYDSNATFDSLDDMSAEERKDALVSALQNANEETEGGVLDMVVPTRVPRNGEGLKHNDLGNRTYEVYANVENPYEIDANGRGSEFESGDVYEAVEKALADELYDGVIVRNWRVGRTQQLGDVVVPKNGNQIKLTSNENPTESSDIRFRTSLELDEEFGDAWRNQQNEDGRHSTQVANTKSTYEKIGHYLEDAGMKGASILDASSGLGLGTQALREMGFQVDDVEPFPSENREAPTFSSYADIDGKYDVVISNAVLNVIPDDWRADVLHQMADAVKEGGKIIINTRPASNIAQQGVEGKTRITLDSPSEILVKRGDRIAAYQKGFTSEELAEWIKSELGEGWRVEKATKKNSGISGEGTAVVIKDGDNVSFRTTGTPTDEVVANGVDLTPSQTSEVAANIFAALPEESRKKITDGLNGNVLGLKDAILQIPASLASKENWNDEDRAMADIVAEEMTKMAGEMTRPFSAPEALWLLYNNLNKSTDLVSLAQRSLVQRNLGFDAQTLATENEAKESLRFRQVGDAMINATAGLYNKGAVNVMTRLKESFVDMNASVEELVKAIEERTGKKAEGFENILWALNQQSSRGLAAMEDYERRFLNPMYDAIRNIMDKAYAGYDSVVRHVILKHGLERNKKLAQRDAKAHYQEIYEEMIAKVNSMDDRQKRTHLTNAQLQDADAKAKLATLKAADTSAFTEEEKNAHKRELAKAKEEVKKAKENLERAQKINSMSEQELKDELDMVFEKIENGTDSVYKELRKNDYSGISSMFYDQLGVNRKDYSTEEEYQAALMLAKNDRFSSLEEVEAQAEGEVSSFEGSVDTKELWKRVNAATKETLRQQYEANMISKDQYDSLRDMFEYYVPLRGFKDNTAEDMYTYYRKPNSTGYTKPILGAEGRKTEAESPFGWIASMAGSAIASNVKNEAKLALFYFVSNRQDNGVATISKTWYVHTPGDVDERGKKIFKPVYPPFSEDLSSDAAKAQYEQWQDDMRKLKEQGLAYEAGQRLNLGNAVVNISDANKPEHIVAVKVGGKEYTIVINGNPRAAQAINGELNLEGTADDYSALFGPVLRWMSSVNTSYNPEFWITNMMRDMAFTWMAVNTKEADDKEYRRKFSKNYRKAFKVISLVAKNEKGTLGNSPIEQAYKDFVENGGVTGYTQIKDNETWEKEIDQYLRSNSPESLKSGKMMRGMKTVFHAAHRFGESLEQVSRFAAFLTARETGKSINEAINDAKEITVNFNRKGSGKMISLEEAKHLTDKNGRPLSKPKQWMVVGLSSIAPLGRRFIMFFNAAIQGLNATYKLWKANPKRFKGWVMGYFAVGAMNAILHAMMDDDDDYLDMPQYERRNALMIGGNGVYLKWALPQEARAFYALGDIVVESMLGRNPQKFWQKGGEVGQILTTIGEVLPINPTEGWRAVAPSIAIPALELMINEDYKGEAIYNDSKWLSKEEASRTANWNTAKSGTGWVHVKIAQGLNFLTGGDKYDAGLINIRPEAIEHLVQSAFGGTIRTADKFVNTITSIIDPEEEWTVKQTPFLNRVLTLNDERYRNVHVNEVFDYYAAEAEHAKTLEKKYRKDGDSDALLDLTSSDEYKWMMIYENYKKPLENVRERLKVAEGTRERKQIMREQDELKMMMIKQISNL